MMTDIKSWSYEYNADNGFMYLIDPDGKRAATIYGTPEKKAERIDAIINALQPKAVDVEAIVDAFVNDNDAEDYPFNGEQYDVDLVKFVFEWFFSGNTRRLEELHQQGHLSTIPEGYASRIAELEAELNRYSREVIRFHNLLEQMNDMYENGEYEKAENVFNSFEITNFSLPLKGGNA